MPFGPMDPGCDGVGRVGPQVTSLLFFCFSNVDGLRVLV